MPVADAGVRLPGLYFAAVGDAALNIKHQGAALLGVEDLAGYYGIQFAALRARSVL